MPKISSIHSAVSIEYRLVTSTDSQTDRHSAVASNRASIAPRGKKTCITRLVVRYLSVQVRYNVKKDALTYGCTSYAVTTAAVSPGYNVTMATVAASNCPINYHDCLVLSQSAVQFGQQDLQKEVLTML